MGNQSGQLFSIVLNGSQLKYPVVGRTSMTKKILDFPATGPFPRGWPRNCWIEI